MLDLYNIIEKKVVDSYKKEIIKIIPLIKSRVLRYLHCCDDIKEYESCVNKNITQLDELFIKQRSIELKQNNQINEAELIVDAIALAILALRKKHGILLHDEQVMAAIIMYGYKKETNIFAEVKTGEGKTYISLLVAYLNSLRGNVHIMTSNPILAERDYNNNLEIFEMLGVDVGLIKHEQNIEEKKETYKKSIVYSDSHEMVFDYLRDLHEINKDKKVHNCHDTLIIDEVDNVLLDQGATPIVLSNNQPSGDNYDNIKTMMIKIEMFVNKLDKKYIEYEDNDVSLTDEGFDYFYKIFNIKNNESLWLLMLNSVLKANYFISSNKEVIFKNENMDFEILSQTTGFPLKDQNYSEPLLTYAIKIHQIYLKCKRESMSDENITNKMNQISLDSENLVLQEINYAKYLSLYERFTGMSGTIIHSKDAFSSIYGAEVIDIPLHSGLNRVDNPLEVFPYYIDKDYRMKQIIDEEIKERPILIKANSIEEANRIYKFLSNSKKSGRLSANINLLTAENVMESEKIIYNAGKKNQITVVTDVAGRGTDFKLDEMVSKYGLCVINTNLSIVRVEQQFFGRSGRQGQNGISYSLTSLDEDIYQKYENIFKDNFNNKYDKEETEEKKNAVLIDFVLNVQKLEEEIIIKKIEENNKIHSILYSVTDIYNLLKSRAIKSQKLDVFFEFDSVKPLNEKERLILNNIDFQESLRYIDKLWLEVYNELLMLVKEPKWMNLDENELTHKLIKKCHEIFNNFMSKILGILRNKIDDELIVLDNIKNLSSDIDDEVIMFLLSNCYKILKFNILKCKNEEMLRTNVINLINDMKIVKKGGIDVYVK